MQGAKKNPPEFADLIGADGIVASISFDQSLRGALYQFERAYLEYHKRSSRLERAQVAGVDVSHFYRRCRQLGVRIA